MELYKNIKEIVELADKELIQNNKETYATLDYEDLVELKDMYNHIIEFYNGETYTANQLKNIEKDRNKYYIHKDKIRDKQIEREFELQQEYKDFENDVEWKTYNKILEEE